MIKEQCDGWQLNEQKHYEKQLQCADSIQCQKLMNAINTLADQQKHHPVITIKEDVITIEVWTHSTNSITEKDMQLMQEIEKILQIYRRSGDLL